MENNYQGIVNLKECLSEALIKRLLEKNDLGLTRRDYEGAVSTLCAGCGHDSISSAIVEACFQLSIESYKVAKLSGIGC